MKHEEKLFTGNKFDSRLFRIFGLILAISVCLFSCEPTDPDEGDDSQEDPPDTATDLYEANDERNDAYVIDLGTEYDAIIDETGDDDWFKFSTAHASNTYDKVEISVSGISSTLYIHLELYGPDGESLDSHGTTTGGQDLTYTFSTPGSDFYIRFSGWDGYVNDHGSTGDYSFTVSNLDVNDEYAPNHTIETAVETVDFSSPASGVIVSRYENDFYKFNNPTPGVWNSYTITLTNVASSLYGTFELYDTDKTSIVGFRDIGATTGGADVTYTIITKEDALYVRVSGWDGYVNDHSSSGVYTLTVVSNGNDDNEPDDTFENAMEITTFPSDISGTILATAANNNGGDYEFFRITLNTDKKVLWSADPDAADTELHFNVYGPDMLSLGSVDGSDGETITGSMNNTGVSSTYFYIKLGGYIGSNGDYTISFTETDAD